MRVLLIDDHELVWNGTRRLLEEGLRDTKPSRELEFRAVRDVEEACALSGEKFELILLDYHLPGIDGLAALARIQALFDEAIVCMLSAESGRERIRAVLEAGAAGFLPKSYGEEEMAAALRLVLRHKAYVPAEFRGRGLAERLVRHGLQWAKAQGYDIQASCWYVRKFIRP